MIKFIRFFFIITLLFVVGCNGSNTSKSSTTTATVTTYSITTSPSEPPVNSSSTRLPQETPITVTSSSLPSKSVKNYSDDEILSFVLKYSNLNETTVKLKDWPETDENQDQLKDPIFFVLVVSRPDSKSNEVDQRDYYSVYFGQNYGDHIARYLGIFVKYDLSEIVLSETGYFDEKTQVIHP